MAKAKQVTDTAVQRAIEAFEGVKATETVASNWVKTYSDALGDIAGSHKDGETRVLDHPEQVKAVIDVIGTKYPEMKPRIEKVATATPAQIETLITKFSGSKELRSTGFVPHCDAGLTKYRDGNFTKSALDAAFRERKTKAEETIASRDAAKTRAKETKGKPWLKKADMVDGFVAKLEAVRDGKHAMKNVAGLDDAIHALATLSTNLQKWEAPKAAPKAAATAGDDAANQSVDAMLENMPPEFRNMMMFMAQKFGAS